MEQWMRDGRQLLFERWQKSTSGVLPNKNNPESVKGVDQKVLQTVLEIFHQNRLRPCVSSQLLSKEFCRFFFKEENEDEETQESGEKNESSSSSATVTQQQQQQNHVQFKFCDGNFYFGTDRSGYFGLIQRTFSSSSFKHHRTSNSRKPKPHSRVLIDYAWIFSSSSSSASSSTSCSNSQTNEDKMIKTHRSEGGRLFDYTTNFSFIAGAGVVPQAMEEAVLHCEEDSVEPCEFLYEVSGDEENNNNNIENEMSTATTTKNLKLEEAMNKNLNVDDYFQEFLCDSEFAFRDEGTKLPATDFVLVAVASSGENNEEKAEEEEIKQKKSTTTTKRIIQKTSDPPFIIPPDATVSLLIRVLKFCEAVSISKHIENAEKLKAKGNELLISLLDAHKNNDNNNSNNNKGSKYSSSSFSSARKWYERAMMELSPEALRESSSSSTTEQLIQQQQQSIKTLLASLSHNISRCFFEEANDFAKNIHGNEEEKFVTAEKDDDHNDDTFSSATTFQQREILKKSIRFASEAIKISDGKHVKSLFRRSVANVKLGNLEEAEEDLKMMEKLLGTEVFEKDQSVLNLLGRIRKEKENSNSILKSAMKHHLASSSS